MNDITPKEANEILSHYTDLGYGVVIEGEDTSKIKQALSFASKTLASGTPLYINVPSANCVSRSVVKDLISDKSIPIKFEEEKRGEWRCSSGVLLSDIYKVIDNAPPVDMKDQIAGAYNEGYMCGSREAEKARPQGKWELHGMIYYCSECGHDCGESGDNFCGNCGADMRKGGAE